MGHGRGRCGRRERSGERGGREERREECERGEGGAGEATREEREMSARDASSGRPLQAASEEDVRGGGVTRARLVNHH